MASSLIDSDLKNNYIANGLSGAVFQAAIENRGVFEKKSGNNYAAKAGAMYICTGETNQISDGGLTFNVPKVIAVEGPDDTSEGTNNYYINITFNESGYVTEAKLAKVGS